MYIGNFDSFRFTAEADAVVNTIVQAGELVGVTRANVEAGEAGLAFMAAPASVYSFEVEALTAAQTMGTPVYVADGVPAFTGDTQIGVLWEDAAAGDTEIKVALK